MKKLRLLLFEECDRACEGCCNKDWDLASLEVEKDFRDYDLIMLTGGEPMLNPQTILRAARRIRETTRAPIILYTAMVRKPETLLIVVNQLDGMTLTLHGQEDVEDFKFLNGMILKGGRLIGNKSLRLNVFKGVDLTGIDLSRWQVKPDIEWIKNCPLPGDEVLKRYREI